MGFNWYQVPAIARHAPGWLTIKLPLLPTRVTLQRYWLWHGAPTVRYWHPVGKTKQYSYGTQEEQCCTASPTGEPLSVPWPGRAMAKHSSSARSARECKNFS